jgi:hypothetical protein
MSPAALILPPRLATRSAMSPPLRLVVPFTMTAWVKLEMPEFAGVSQREPMRSSSATATTGATRFSRTITVMPLSSRATVTASPGACAAASHGTASTAARARASTRGVIGRPSG